MATGYLHLDSEYKRRWQEFHMADGTILDSRQINWRNVEWEKVVKLTVNMEGQYYEVGMEGKAGFVCFINFRCGGQEIIRKPDGKEERRRIHTWVIGWTNGNECFLQEIDFYRGGLVRRYVDNVKNLKSHIHPRCRAQLRLT